MRFPRRAPRLSRREWDDLFAAHTKLEAVSAELGRTNWAGASACRVLVGEVDVLIAHLWNKAEGAFNPQANPESTETAQERPLEANAEANPSLGEIAAPAKEGA